jgi:phospholipid/cholesterol/gamma-HCH transport system permease protein
VTAEPQVSVHRDGDGTLVVRVTGDWLLEGTTPMPDAAAAEIHAEPPSRVVFQASGLGRWDSSLVSFLALVGDAARAEGLGIDTTGLPRGLQHLLALAGGPKRPIPPPPPHQPLPTRIGAAGIDIGGHAAGMLDFVGRASLAVKDVVTGRGHFEWRDFWLLLEQTGGAALPLVAIINFLVGAVLAFLGAVQLQQFNATIFVANLVGVGTVRETGALMTGIVMAGRTGASFAAVLGTMTVNSEVDALETMNFPPMEFLVAPRILAMVLMMPLLVLYADLFGILGGYVVAVGLLDLTPALYLTQTRESMVLADVLVGLFKAPAFGAVVALAGTYFGMSTGRTASSVGTSTTRAVVSGILLVIVVDAVLTVFFYAVKL